jgi:hypothetical protein
MTEKATNPYPEHAKQEAVIEQSQAIGEFLDTSGFVLAEFREIDGHDEPKLMPVGRSIEQVLAEYFEIDLNKIEAEKRDMLEHIRAANA